MAQTLGQIFITHSVEKLRQLTDRILTCLARLNEDQIWTRGGDHENAIGNLILHLCGNLRQWIGSGVGNLENIRVRDLEFSARGGTSNEELRAKLEGTVDLAIGIIAGLDEQALLRITTVQGYTIPVMQAVAHVVEHFAQHTGQIILLTKHATGEDLGFYRHLSQTAHSEKTP